MISSGIVQHASCVKFTGLSAGDPGAEKTAVSVQLATLFEAT